MEKIIIEGGKRLTGEVEISGFKNAAVAIMPATLLAGDICTIENLPGISDVKTLSKILQVLGANIEIKDKNTMEIDTSSIKDCFVNYEDAKDLRASYYFLGAALARFKKASVVYPGGCFIGSRHIDQHIKGFEALGARVKVEQGIITAEADRLVGAKIYLDVVSVGATINIMFAATMAEGVTVIENAAKEPHIVDVANFLNCMGAQVVGAGTDTIRIKGVKKLHGCNHSVIPDQIEAGTYMIAAAATGGDVVVKNIIPKHLDAIIAKLREMGVEITENGDSLRVKADKTLKNVNVKTLVYPGFPTDLQQPMSSLLSISKGVGVISETIFEGRFKHVDELKRMGANIKVDGRTAIVQGVEKLTGAKVNATDLRAGAALVIAGLAAEGRTEITNIHYIQRGYDDLCKKLANLGADIKEV